jgi:hypothetical protein
MEVSAWQWSTTKLIAFEYNFHTGLRPSDIGPTAFHLGWVQFIALHLSIILLADGRPPPPTTFYLIHITRFFWLIQLKLLFNIYI